MKNSIQNYPQTAGAPFLPRLSGTIRCTKYAFGPNRLHYCGPDANREIYGYLKEDTFDAGLEILLTQFKTLYPYLRLIASSNGIKDAFDERVVEAYWIGNSLLNNVGTRALYKNITEEHIIQKKIPSKDFTVLSEKIGSGALPHHSFHVLNIWKRTGHTENAHTPESINECVISWGEVISVSGPDILINARRINLEGYKISLSEPGPRKITRRLDAPVEFDGLKAGDIITVHWGVPCEVISKKQASALYKFTLQSIGLSNQSI